MSSSFFLTKDLEISSLKIFFIQTLERDKFITVKGKLSASLSTWVLSCIFLLPLTLNSSEEHTPWSILLVPASELSIKPGPVVRSRKDHGQCPHATMSSNHLVMDHRNLELNSSQRTEDFIPGKSSIRHLACQLLVDPKRLVLMCLFLGCVVKVPSGVST